MKYKNNRSFFGLIAIFILSLMLAAQVVYSAGTVTVGTRVITDSQWARGIREIKWSWASTAGTASAVGGIVSNVTGTIWGIKAEPHQTNMPDHQYDIAILDLVNGMDVLNGDGADFHQSASQVSNLRVPVDSQNGALIPLVTQTLYFSGTNLNSSGAASGIVYLYILLP